MKTLKARLENCISLYIDYFCIKHNVYAEDRNWIGGITGSIIEIDNETYLDFSDIRTDLERDAPKDAIWDWYWNYSDKINYSSYLMGARDVLIK